MVERICYIIPVIKQNQQMAILVEENQQVNFEPISDQICKTTIKLTNSDTKLII